MSLPKEELQIYMKLSQNFVVVFDIGCRDDIEYYEVKKDCEYHLFEPNTEALESIKSKISLLSDHNIILNEFGLSNENKDDCIYYKNVQSFTPHWSAPSFDSGERFSLKRLDDYVESKGITAIDFLKIDVEGLDYSVILGGLETIKNNNKVSYIQIENSGGNKRYVDLLDNFHFYLMMEPELLKVINTVNNIGMDFNKSLIKLDEAVITFLDTQLIGTGAGANILGVRKDIDFDFLSRERGFIFPIANSNKLYTALERVLFRALYDLKNVYRSLRKWYKMLLFKKV